MEIKVGDIVFVKIGLTIQTCIIKGIASQIPIKRIDDTIDGKQKEIISFIVSQVAEDGTVSEYNYTVDKHNVFTIMEEATISVQDKVVQLLKRYNKQ